MQCLDLISCLARFDELAKAYPLPMISPCARNFLDGTFVNVQSLRDTEGEPHLDCDVLVQVKRA